MSEITDMTLAQIADEVSEIVSQVRSLVEDGKNKIRAEGNTEDCEAFLRSVNTAIMTLARDTTGDIFVVISEGEERFKVDQDGIHAEKANIKELIIGE